MSVLPRPSKRIHGHAPETAKPFYWSGGPAPTTKRGKRTHAAREGVRREHAEAIHGGGKIYPKGLVAKEENAAVNNLPH